LIVTKELCDAIEKIRRKLKNISKRKIIFIDETHLKLNEACRSTLVAPGENEYVIVNDNTSYSKRYDMIACCSGEQTFPCMIYTPNERTSMNVKGINKKMLIKYIQDILAQAVGATDLYPIYLVMDRSTIHNEDEMMEAFHDNGCQSLVEIIKMPTQSAKRLSPLDNTLFHQWKEKCRQHNLLTNKNIEQIMNDEWNRISPINLYSYYRHCGLTTSPQPYFDCPLPSLHKHKK
jgi:DDE superfamily endonuclease